MDIRVDVVSGASLIALAGLIWSVLRSNRTKVPEKKCEEHRDKITDCINSCQTEVNNKVSYQSFDRYKSETKESYTSKDVCDERFNNVMRMLNEIREDVKFLLRKNGYDKTR